MEFAGLPLADPVAGLPFVPGAVELLGRKPELNHEFADRSAGLASPRFSCHSRMSAVSSPPMMTRASDPPTKWARSEKPAGSRDLDIAVVIIEISSLVLFALVTMAQ